MTRWRTRHRGSHAERGAAAVEFAIVLVVLLLIIFAIIDFGRLLFVSQSMKAASREGARTGVVATGNGQTVYDAVTNAGSSAAALAGGQLTVQIQPPGVSLVSRPTTASPPHNNVLESNGTTTLGICGAAGSTSALTVTARTPFSWFTPVGIFSSSVNEVFASTTMRCE